MNRLSTLLAILPFVLSVLGIVLSNLLLGDLLWSGLCYLGAGASAIGWLLLNWKRAVAFASQKSTRNGANLTFVFGLVLAIVLVSNFIAKEYSFRKDITRSGVNSLSPQTLKVLDALTEDVQIQYFNSEQQKFRPEVLLKNYVRQSRHLKYEFVDTLRKPTITATAGVKRNDTIVLTAAGSKKQVKVEGATEEKITNGLIKLARSKGKVVYFLEGHNEPSLDAAEDGLAFTVFKAELEKQGYEAKPLNLVSAGKMPDDLTVLVIAGPKTSFFPKELDLLTAWLKDGGHALLAFDLDPIAGGLAKGSLQLANLISAYGVSVDSHMLVDPLSSAANVAPQILLGFAASKDHPITKDFPISARAANFFFPLSTQFLIAGNQPYAATALVHSSPQAWSEHDWASLRKEVAKYEAGVDFKGEMTLAMALEPTSVPAAKDRPALQGKGPHLVLFATSSVAANSIIDKVGNRDLMLNAIAWLSDDSQLISIRPKAENSTLSAFNLGTIQLVFIFSVFLFPAAIVIAGVVVWMRRSKL
jgi:ABC-type uncharacterized transport system involved in gliding motility auxiliary subunit